MGHSQVVRVMLLRGADRDAARNDGTTALLKAANKGYNDVIEELLKFSPTLGILKNGTSALHAAVLSGNIKTVALLLEAGADPALRNKVPAFPSLCFNSSGHLCKEIGSFYLSQDNPSHAP